VTGACMMSRREVFEEVGGFSTLFPLNFNDVDYCLKLWHQGYRVAWDVQTKLFHFESSSRSTDVTLPERELLVRRWSTVTVVDPFYNEKLLVPVHDLEPKLPREAIH
ncbi:MAG TPA: hypothetical protein VGJ86_08635, partial [Acidimicrobiales bacterium]